MYTCGLTAVIKRICYIMRGQNFELVTATKHRGKQLSHYRGILSSRAISDTAHLSRYSLEFLVQFVDRRGRVSDFAVVTN